MLIILMLIIHTLAVTMFLFVCVMAGRLKMEPPSPNPAKLANKHNFCYKHVLCLSVMFHGMSNT